MLCCLVSPALGTRRGLTRCYTLPLRSFLMLGGVVECVAFGEEYNKQTYFLPEGNMVAHGSEIFSLTFLFLLLLLLITSHILVTSVAKICRTGFPQSELCVKPGCPNFKSWCSWTLERACRRGTLSRCSS